MSECDTCRKVKANYMKPGRLLQPLSIPELKWDDIRMDFFVGLPLLARKFDSIWVNVDRLSKSTTSYPSTPTTTLIDMPQLHVYIEF
jgi:hypothetical protein